jgi:hypothetical protein
VGAVPVGTGLSLVFALLARAESVGAGAAVDWLVCLTSPEATAGRAEASKPVNTAVVRPTRRMGRRKEGEG